MTRAAAYCRVSTDGHDQTNSFESQKRYFKNYIENRADWVLAGLYADEGITGTTTEARTGFLQMIDDAHLRKFDVVITKEVSRFSRNILDAVAYTRALRAIGVTVIFLNDGISTAEPDAELRLGIMASVAQEESRKTSERVKWGQQRKMERGVVFGRSLLGYDVRGGNIVIEPQGAETVRMIFDMYLREKLGVRAVAAALTESGIQTYSGLSTWSGASILKILRNEKYCGDLVQRKTVTTDFLTHKKEKNRDTTALIRCHDHHEPIVSRADWEAVQEALSQRSCHGGQIPKGSRYALSGKIFCGVCGAVYRCRTRKRRDGTRYRVWARQCACASAHRQLREDALGRCVGQFIKSLGQETLLFGFKERLSKFTGLTEAGNAAIRQDIARTAAKLTKLADKYLEGDIGRETYLELREKYGVRLEKLEGSLAEKTDATQDSIEAINRESASGGEGSGALFLGLTENVQIRHDGAVDIFLQGIRAPLRAVYK